MRIKDLNYKPRFFPNYENICYIHTYDRNIHRTYVRRKIQYNKVNTMYIIKMHKYILQLEYLRLNYNLNKFKETL